MEVTVLFSRLRSFLDVNFEICADRKWEKKLLSFFTEDGLLLYAFYFFSISMVVMWTCGDIFKTSYFLLREAPLQFWICGSIQVTVDLLILLQVFIYRGNVEPQRSSAHRGDWVVIIWTHDEIRHKDAETADEIAVLEESKNSIEHVNGDAPVAVVDNTVYNEESPSVKLNNDCHVVSAEIHNENDVVTTTACVVSRDDDSGADDDDDDEEGEEEGDDDSVVVDIVNNKENKYAVNGDMVKRASQVTYKQHAKNRVSMLIHRHTLWRILFVASVDLNQIVCSFDRFLKCALNGGGVAKVVSFSS